jgi:hypothetical protein
MRSAFEKSSETLRVGAVRVLPIGLTASPTIKRYQYHRPGSNPRASTWTECPDLGDATAEPRSAIFFIRSSAAISHLTVNACGGMPPPLSGSGASRVHNTTPSGSGSPEATPRLKGSDVNFGDRACA